MCKNPKDWFLRECGLKEWFRIRECPVQGSMHRLKVSSRQTWRYKNYNKNDDLSSSTFSRGIFGRPILFLVFKLVLLLYWSTLWSWRLVDFYILSPAKNWEQDKNFTRTREYPDYLTNWGDTLIMIYMLYSTLLAIRIFYLESRKISGDIGKATMGRDGTENDRSWGFSPRN